MTHAEIRRIVLLLEPDAATELATLVRAESAAYMAYCGGVRVPSAAGTSVTAGHGSWVCDLNAGGVQDRWREALARLEVWRRVRSGAWRPSRQNQTVCYQISGHDLGTHQIEVAHHGLDLSECDNPAAAIAAVQATL